MLKINGKVWYKPLVNSCYVNDLSDFAGDATENECVLGGINWVWYHYPTFEEALEGLDISKSLYPLGDKIKYIGD